MGRWMQRARELQTRVSTAPDSTSNILAVRTLIDSVSASDADQESRGSEITWRVAAFRAAIPANGPIWVPRIQNTAHCDTPGHCSLCGDVLPIDPARRFPRCIPCVRALWLALNEIREQIIE